MRRSGTRRGRQGQPCGGEEMNEWAQPAPQICKGTRGKCRRRGASAEASSPGGVRRGDDGSAGRANDLSSQLRRGGVLFSGWVLLESRLPLQPNAAADCVFPWPLSEGSHAAQCTQQMLFAARSGRYKVYPPEEINISLRRHVACKGARLGEELERSVPAPRLNP